MFPTAHGVVSQVVAGQPSGGGGAVEFIASTNGTHSGDTTTETLTVPEGAQAGDLLVAVVASNHNLDAVSDFDGWTHIHTALNPNFDRQTNIAYVVLGAEPPESYTWTFSQSTNRARVVLCFRGQNPTTPILDHGWNKNSFTPPELTAVDGCAAVGAWRWTSFGGDAPPEMTPIVEAYGAGSNVSLTVGIETGLVAGPYSRTAPNGNVSNRNASMVLIQP